MNKEDMKKLQEINNLISQALGMINDLSMEHQDRIDNMPENLQGSDKYQTMEDKQSSLDDIRDNLESLESDLQMILE